MFVWSKLIIFKEQIPATICLSLSLKIQFLPSMLCNRKLSSTLRVTDTVGGMRRFKGLILVKTFIGKRNLNLMYLTLTYLKRALYLSIFISIYMTETIFNY